MWTERVKDLLRLAERQLFFVGGPPRSGTTWLQRMLDSHPDVSCRGEGLFMVELAKPLDELIARRRRALDEKNTQLFRDFGGYPLPSEQDSEMLLGTAILLAVERQSGSGDYRAIGEKTPENVFFFPRLKQLFPGAKFIGMLRDPRDALSSAWHLFHAAAPHQDEVADKISFIRGALPSLDQGARAMLVLRQQFPPDCLIVTYETLSRAPLPTAAALFRFLGVSDREEIVADCVAKTAFAELTGGRPAGVAQGDAFLRKGVIGDWRSTFTPQMGEIITRDLGWMYPHFGWEL